MDRTKIGQTKLVVGSLVADLSNSFETIFLNRRSKYPSNITKQVIKQI